VPEEKYEVKDVKAILSPLQIHMASPFDVHSVIKLSLFAVSPSLSLTRASCPTTLLS
jgi:hypothetical protein